MVFILKIFKIWHFLKNFYQFWLIFNTLQIYKGTGYLVQYLSKVISETADAKIKISSTKNDDKEMHYTKNEVFH